MRLPAVAIVAAIGGGILLGLEPLRAFRAAHSSLSVFVDVAVIFPLIPGFVLACLGFGDDFACRVGWTWCFWRLPDGPLPAEHILSRLPRGIFHGRLLYGGGSYGARCRTGRFDFGGFAEGPGCSRDFVGATSIWGWNRGGSSFDVFVVAGISATGCCHLRRRRRYPSFRRAKKVLLGVPARNFWSGCTKAGHGRTGMARRKCGRMGRICR